MDKLAIFSIVQEGDEILRQKAQVVRRFDERLHRLLDDMAETLHGEEGVGLAAPQIGVSKRVVVIDVGEGLIELVNPEIVAHAGEETTAEGCLSIKGRNGLVTRYYQATVKAQNRYGEEFTLDGEGLLARAFQHEIDHLDGILFIDRMIRELRPEEMEEEE